MRCIFIVTCLTIMDLFLISWAHQTPWLPSQAELAKRALTAIPMSTSWSA
jgi:hypothetical protein